MHLHSDKPIKYTRDDLLGRKILARNIAKSLTNWKGDESLVLALNGPWGSGKSSVKNMVIESLRADPDGAIIVDFNPWEISASRALTEEFFNAIADQIPNIATDTKAKESAERLRKWGRGLSRVAWGGKKLSSLLRLFGFVEPASLIAAEVIDRGSEKMEEAGEEATSGAAEIEAGIDERSLSDQKKEIGMSLSNLDRPFIVMIDDIDRLSSDEICLLFRLIKANCDFPNFAFLLLFDRPYVCSALDRITNQCGAEYLEKIVQVALTIGIPDRDIIRRLLKREVLSLLPVSAKREPLWSEERWNLLIDYYVVEGLRHIRDLRRLVNSFSVSLAALSTKRHCEVNPIDLLVIEHLRLSEAGFYEHLPRFRWILVGETNSLFDHLKNGVLESPAANEILIGSTQRGLAEKRKNDGVQTDLYREYRDEILLPVPQEKRRHIEVLLPWLFPRCPAFRTTTGQTAAIRALHIGHPSMFDIYFHRAIPFRRISQATVEKIVRLAGKPKEFLQALCEELEGRRHELLIEHLMDRAPELIKHGCPMLVCLTEFAEQVARVQDEQYNWQSIPNLFSKCLFGLNDATERWEAIVRVIDSTKNVRLLAEFGAAMRKNDLWAGFRMLPEGKLPELCDLLSAHFSRNYSAAVSIDIRDLMILLWRWRDIDGLASVRAWLRKEIREPKNVWKLLYACSSPSKFDGRIVTAIGWRAPDIGELLTKKEWMDAAASATPIGKLESSVSEAFWMLFNNDEVQWPAPKD